MFPAWLATTSAVMAGEVTPAPNGRDLLFVDGTTLDGNGPGGGLFVTPNLADLGDVAGLAEVGFTLKPVRLGLALPVAADTPHLSAGPARADLRLVLADRREGGLGVAADVAVPLPFPAGPASPWSGRLSLAVGTGSALVAANVGVHGGDDDPFDQLDWGLGGGVPVVGPLSAFAELVGRVGLSYGDPIPGVTLPGPPTVRAGLHLAPIRPLVFTLALSGQPGETGLSALGGALWIPPERPRHPPLDGRDRDDDGIVDLVDGCPDVKEDLDGGNDADGCPDGGSTAPLEPPGPYGGGL
jgi:hypothetical protein